MSNKQESLGLNSEPTGVNHSGRAFEHPNARNGRKLTGHAITGLPLFMINPLGVPDKAGLLGRVWAKIKKG